MQVKLITLNGVLIDKEVYELIIPTSAGEIGVFPGHEPLVTVAKAGVISVRYNKSDPSDAMDTWAISSGIVEITPSSVKILVDAADSAETIGEEEAKQALEHALELKANAKNEMELEKAYDLIDRHSVRLQVAQLRRHKKR